MGDVDGLTRSGPAGPDFRAVFASLPTAYLVMSPDLVIVEANQAYLRLLQRTREEIVGRPVFDAFPPAPEALDENGRNPVQVSLERARDTGKPDQMPLVNYDVLDKSGGRLVQRFWSLISAPVLDQDGRTQLILQRVEDVTEYVRDRRARQADRERGQRWQRRSQAAEADLYARAKELEAARDAEALATSRLAALADVALQLAHAQTVDDLTDIIADRGLTALGADGGAVAVRQDGDVLRLTITGSLGERTRAVYGTLPLDGPLPASVVASTGQRILIPDAEAALRHHPSMQEVIEDTGCPAWACLPLRVEGRLLGSLSVGWVRRQEFSARETELLDALAAQCAYGLDRIQARQSEQESAAAARRMSEALQRSMLSEPPPSDDVRVVVRYHPAAHEAQVGGDWYDAFVTADGMPCFVIGDVAGHDRDAAAAMGQVRSLLRGIAYTVVDPPAAVLSTLDRSLRDLDVKCLATGVLVKLDDLDAGAGTGSRVVRWSNAGHLPPLLIDADGTTRLLQTEPDLLLGFDASTRRGAHQIVLEPGATLLLYTDGLIERRDASVDAGLDWLLAATSGLAGLGLDALCDELLAQVGAPGEDDIALLALRVLPTRAPVPPGRPAG